MIVSYDPLLIVLSVVIAVLGSYTGLQLARRLVPKRGPLRKALLSGAAVTIGGGIWSMHFVGMLAIQLPVTINYDVLLTLISALLAILVTGFGLFLASFGQLTRQKLALAGLMMGLGISTMHYVGMMAVRANCVVNYNGGLVMASILIGVAASTLALWLAFNLRGAWQTLAAAVVLGFAISGMHYTAMAAATFMPVEVLVEFAAPAFGPHLLAIVVTFAVFLICGFALLISLPDLPETEMEQPASSASGTRQDPEKPGAAPVADRLLRLPVEKNRMTLLLDPDDVVSIQAEAHYTQISDGKEVYFCSYSLSELESRLDPVVFLRVH